MEKLEDRLGKQPPILRIECHENGEQMQVRGLLDGIWTAGIEERLEQLDQIPQIAADVSSLRFEIAELTELLQREFTKQFNAEQERDDSYCPYIFVLRGSTYERAFTGLLEYIHTESWLDDARAKLWKETVELQLYCHAPGHWHPLGYERGRDDQATGLYRLETSSEFLRAVAPHLVKLSKLMKYALPLVGFAGVAALTGDQEKQFKSDITAMTKFADKVPATFEETRESKLARGLGEAERASGSALRALRVLLKEKDQAETWGGLARFSLG